MLGIYFTLFNVLATVAFVAMWLDDKRRWYLLHWGLANIMGPVIIYSSTVLAQVSTPSFSFHSSLYALAAGYASAGLVIGAYYYREESFKLGWRLIFYLGVPVSLWVLASTSEFHLSRTLFIVMLVASYLRIASLLWSKRFIERVAALLFVADTCVILASYQISVKSNVVYDSSLALSFSAAIAAINLLVLLLISFQKGAADLKRNIQFLGILHSITAVIHKVKTETELCDKVLSTLLKEDYWATGVLMRLSTDGEYLELLDAKGSGGLIKRDLESNRVLLAGTISENVIKTGRPEVVMSGSLKTVTLNNVVRKLYQNYNVNSRTHIVIPISDRGKPIGVLAITDDQDRRLLPQELETLISIGEVVGFAFENIKQLKTLNYRASHDVLTGLGNRVGFHDHCQTIMVSKPFTLMLFDLDNFKEVNDVFGHAVGDKLLQALAQHLAQALAEQASLFRLGGDEFVVVYTQTASFNSTRAAEVLLEQIKAPIGVDELYLQSEVSIGVVDTKIAGTDSHELLRCADLAMYKAKRSQTSIAYYDKAYDASVRARIELLSNVNDALLKREFELYYQPLIDVKTNTCLGCEGLLRWHHPVRGLLNAAEFIPVIETTEYIGAVTRRVIELAVQDIAAWTEQGIDMSVAINLSARNFLDPTLPEFLIDTVKAFNIPAKLLPLEITETVLMKDPKMAERITQRLDEAGFNIVLDDFGTGYSSLSYLGRFPINTVKIDRSFIAKMAYDQRSKNIVEATIDLTHKLGFLVTAEGVEDQEVVAILKALDCDFVQGFLYSKAINKIDFDTWYENYG